MWCKFYDEQEQVDAVIALCLGGNRLHRGDVPAVPHGEVPFPRSVTGVSTQRQKNIRKDLRV